jgi:hypothetical protein
LRQKGRAGEQREGQRAVAEQVFARDGLHGKASYFGVFACRING